MVLALSKGPEHPKKKRIMFKKQQHVFVVVAKSVRESPLGILAKSEM